MDLLPILTPPLLGAFIGWITNVIAIKMLFRPLRPWRVLGLRLPMTPGVIPAKRHDLARNIGRMVGAQLLTSADIGQAMADPTFKRELETLVDSRLQSLLQQNLGPLATLIPQRFHASFEAGVNILRWRTLKILHGYLDSPEFAQALSGAIHAHLDLLLTKKPWTDLLPTGPGGSLDRLLEPLLRAALTSPETERWLRDFCRQRLEEVIHQGKSLNDLLPAEFSPLLINLLGKEAPGLLAKAARFACEPQMRARLAKTMGAAVTAFVASLGPMAALAGSFLSPERVEAKINDYLASKGDDIASWLNNDLTRVKAQAVLEEKVHDFLARPLAELLADLPAERLLAITDALADQALALLGRPQVAANLADLLGQGLKSQATSNGTLLADLLGQGGVERVKDWTAAEIIAIIRAPKSKRLLDQVLTALVDQQLLAQPLGPLAKLLPKDVRNGFCDYLVQQSHNLLVAEAPRLMGLVNIQRIVTRKVDSLDLPRLEQLLLDIMEEQFKYINLFGGLLGFLIGLVNLLFLP